MSLDTKPLCTVDVGNGTNGNAFDVCTVQSIPSNIINDFLFHKKCRRKAFLVPTGTCGPGSGVYGQISIYTATVSGSEAALMS